MTVPETRICLIHGAATTGRVWWAVAGELSALLPQARIVIPERPASGSLDAEVAALTEVASGAIVVGVSGGATLGLELAARGVPMRAAILHEPAVGSLLPGLLDAVAAAYAQGGVPAFATTLYGPAWSPEQAPADPLAVSRDLAMFRSFEPRASAAEVSRVLVTVGGASPPARHEAARLLGERLGYAVETLPGCGHAVHLEHPRLLAALTASLAETLAARTPDADDRTT